MRARVGKFKFLANTPFGGLSLHLDPPKNKNQFTPSLFIPTDASHQHT